MAAPIIDPQKVWDLIASGAGAFLTMLFQRSSSKLAIITTLASAEIMAFYFARPLWSLLHAHFPWCDDDWRGPIDLTLGLLSIFFLSGVTKLFSQFAAAPLDLILSVVSRVLPWRKGN